MLYENLICSLSIMLVAVVIDLIIGEVPDKLHPVIYMGKTIDYLKKYLPKTRISGLLIILSTSFIFVCISLILLIIFSYINIWIFILFSSLLLSTTFSIKFLIDSVYKIQMELEQDINIARKSMSYLVSRNTEELSEAKITSAAIETLTENITDSIVSPLFYTFIFSLFNIIIAICIAVFYRVSNTMDAMLGYKSKELIDIGRYPAILDDILNYIPARITGYYVILAAFILKYDYKQSYDVMKKFALKTPSPNSGYSMSAAAGALNITLIKEGVYQLGYGTDNLSKEKISDAIILTKVTSLLFILTIVVLFFILLLLVL